MSWFHYDYPEPRSIRKGVCLRASSFPLDLKEKAIKIINPHEDDISNLTLMIKVKEIRPNNQVLLEFWSRIAGKDPFNRHVVVHLLVDEDPKWVCEGDVGRGWKPNKPKKSKNIKRKNK